MSYEKFDLLLETLESAQLSFTLDAAKEIRSLRAELEAERERWNRLNAHYGKATSLHLELAKIRQEMAASKEPHS